MSADTVYRRPVRGQKVKTEARPRSPHPANQQAEKAPPLLFSRPEAMLYTSLATLPQRAGVSAEMLPTLVVKELTDNALDSSDAAGRPGAVTIGIDPHGNLTIEDDGDGIADATPEKLAGIFCVARPMVSSKLLRRPTRGCVGNGLRVCLGYLTATRGRLIIETGNVRVELAPEIDGTSRIVSNELIARRGLKLTAIAGDVRFEERNLRWAADAIEVAQQSGQPAFTGRPSPHWFDRDHFIVLARSVVGDISVRTFISQFDGITGSKVQTEIAAPFLRRGIKELTDTELAELLWRMQLATKPPKARALRPLGRDAVISGGYAIAEGAFRTGQHEPRATIPFLVECWADALHPEDQGASFFGALLMNRTLALAPFTGQAWHGRLDLSISGTTVSVPAPAGPSYEITANITAPMFLMTSDGKTPSCHTFRAEIAEAIGKAAGQAGRSIAAIMSASDRRIAARLRQEEREEEKALRISDRQERLSRRARQAEQKAERQKLPSIKAVVLELLPGAVKEAGESGYLFNTRHLLYRIRDEVLRRTEKDLEQSYFDQLVTAIEAEHGDLHPLLIREARGNFRVPHLGITVPLGTLAVRQFLRPAWTFNKIVAIEKEDLRLMLEQAGWDRRHDAMLMSSKGFNSRAARDLIDKIAETTEPVRVFSVHDADAAGTLIQHTLQHATLARGARKIEIVDIGLQPWEGIALGLAVEKVTVKTAKGTGKTIRRPVGAYVRQRRDRTPKRETWEQWLQHSRFELNAFTSAELIAWLDRKMAEHDTGKLIPPDDILADGFAEHARSRVSDDVAEAIESRCDDVVTAIVQQRDELVAAIKAEEAEAKKPIVAEIDRVSAPLLAELSRVRAPLLEQMAAITAPLHARITETQETHQQRIETVRSEAEAIDHEAEVARVIEGMRPAADKLRNVIADAFAKEPMRHWEPVLHEITDATEVGAIEIELTDGNDPDRSPDDGETP
jgi:hypothetical protein